MFLTHLDARAIPKGNWLLLSDLDFLYEECLIRAPKGFISDLASIPKGLRWLISVNEDHRQAAVIHDFLYSKKGEIDFFMFSRAEADEVFLYAMKVSGVSWWKRKLMFRAVRLGGWYRWSKA